MNCQTRSDRSAADWAAISVMVMASGELFQAPSWSTIDESMVQQAKIDGALGVLVDAASSARASSTSRKKGGEDDNGRPRRTRPTYTSHQKSMMLECTPTHSRNALLAWCCADCAKLLSLSLSITDYQANKFPSAQERDALGEAIGLPARNVQVWFQNRRQRQKPANEKSTLRQRGDIPYAAAYGMLPPGASQWKRGSSPDESTSDDQQTSGDRPEDGAAGPGDAPPADAQRQSSPAFSPARSAPLPFEAFASQLGKQSASPLSGPAEQPHLPNYAAPAPLMASAQAALHSLSGVVLGGGAVRPSVDGPSRADLTAGLLSRAAGLPPSFPTTPADQYEYEARNIAASLAPYTSGQSMTLLVQQAAERELLLQARAHELVERQVARSCIDAANALNAAHAAPEAHARRMPYYAAYGMSQPVSRAAAGRAGQMPWDNGTCRSPSSIIPWGGRERPASAAGAASKR
jgi:hypothetical protein